MPESLRVLEALERAARGTSVLQYLSPGGNGGDALIDTGFFHLAQKHKIPYKLVSASQVDLNGTVVIGGSGGLVAEQAASRTRDYIEQFSTTAKRLLVLPQTVTGNEPLLGKLPASVEIFAREDRTAAHFETYITGGARVGIDHDMAFNVDVNKLLSSERSLPRPAGIKDVARYGYNAHALLRGRFSKNLYAFRSDSEAATEGLKRPLRHDISKVTAFLGHREADRLGSAKLFLQILSHYDQIFTDRLHIGVGAILLGKTLRWQNNSNGKVLEVFKYSVDPNPHVEFANA